MKYLIFPLIFHILSTVLLNAQTSIPLIDKDDLTFLRGITKAVLDSSRIYPGQVLSNGDTNNTKGILIRPGGKDDYPSFWIRDYAMSLETGMISIPEQKHMLLLTASRQCDQAWITAGGSLVPFGSIPDHIRIGDSLPIYFPGTYDFKEQGNKIYGMVPPYCDQFYFIQMADYYVSSTGDLRILATHVNGMRLIDRLETAFRILPSRESGIVYTDENFRGVDFGFRDAIEITGDLCFPSILKYRAALQLAGLFDKMNNRSRSSEYRQIANRIKKELPVLFAAPDGMLRASTGISNQPDVWATALAVYYKVLEKEQLSKACTALSESYAKGTLSYQGNIRHIRLTDDFSATSAWQKTTVEKNRYQNGAYWGTPTGWVAYAIAKVNRNNARQLVKEYIDDLRKTDFRRGKEYGGPYECFYPPDYKQNALYLATVACPYIVLKSAF